MNLHIFGHSICRRAEGHPVKTFIDLVFDHYDLPEQNLHQFDQCSEERILYELKKTKDVDCAVIFHSHPGFFFCPSFNRDWRKIAGTEWLHDAWPQIEFNPLAVNDSRNKDNLVNLAPNQYKPIYDEYVRYWHTNDLNANRHNGALMQIDQYIRYKQIGAVHLTLKNTIPPWFKFSWGAVDTDLAEFQNKPNPYACSHAQSKNAITEKGNRIIADRLIEYIGQVYN